MAASDPSRPVSRVPSSERLASAASDETATEDDFKVITSLDMEVVDGGKNFSSGIVLISHCAFLKPYLHWSWCVQVNGSFSRSGK
jgi:hypothetical protein